MTVAAALLRPLRQCALMLAMLLPFLSLHTSSLAQQVVVRSARGATPSGGFAIPKEDTVINEALAEFERYCEKRAWEKAFTALGKVAEAKPTGLTPAEDGFYVPTRARLRKALVGLPPEGREAYRLFHDAKAKQRFAQLTAPSEDDPTDGPAPAPEDEIAALQELFDLYFVSSIGDQIADRLGDAKFETGDFSGAAHCWAAVLADYPDTSLDPLRLRTKYAIALARGGRRDEFNSALTEIREKFPSQTVRVGGGDVVAVSFLEELAASSRPSADPFAPAPHAHPLALPQGDEPLWQSLFADDAFFAQMRSTVNNQAWGYNPNLGGAAPASAVDARRIYLNWFGIGMAIDHQTGKLLWRTQSFKELGPKLQQIVMYGAGGDDYSVTVTPDGAKVLFVSSTGPGNQGQSSCRLSCLGVEDGKPVWTSETGSLSNWSFAPDPIVRGDSVFAAAHPGGSTELHLLAVNLPDGKLLWSIPLGTVAAGQNYRGMMVMPQPVLRLEGGVVYVLTSNGALLAVNLASRRIEWAFKYDTPAPANREFAYYPRGREAAQFPASLLMSGSTLFIKDKSNDAMYALDPRVPSLKWKRPIDASAALVAVHGSSLFVLGAELSCINLESRDMTWSTKTPLDSGNTRPLVSGDRMLLYGSRGLYELDLKTGQRTIFRGYDRAGTGAAVWRVGDRLICVSNRSVTAYPMPGKPGSLPHGP